MKEAVIKTLSNWLLSEQEIYNNFDLKKILLKEFLAEKKENKFVFIHKSGGSFELSIRMINDVNFASRRLIRHLLKIKKLNSTKQFKNEEKLTLVVKIISMFGDEIHE